MWPTEPGGGPASPEWPADAVSRPYSFLLFGRFEAREGSHGSIRLDAPKLQAMLSYLLLFRRRPHQREVLAAILWSGSPRERARKNLRQGLWQLQSRTGPAGRPLLLSGKDWVQVNQSAVWLDVAELEAVFARLGGVPGERLTGAEALQVEAAAHLYRGDLLEGWKEEWCAFERRRLRTMNLALLEKLLAFNESAGRWEQGLAWGEHLLRLDRAHERAHRLMMLLWYRAGNRTAALRQFESCRSALAEELGVGPGRLTVDVYRQICADRVEVPAPAAGRVSGIRVDSGAPAGRRF